MKKLPRAFYNRDTTLVARELLGHHLVHEVEGVKRIGKIVEVEAYVGQHDLACHTSKGLTKRTATMFGEPGHAYVYLIYGIYHCLNVVTEPAGNGSAVLIRALEPLEHLTARTTGPGLLCNAMGIDKTLNGADLLGDQLYIVEGPMDAPKIVEATRVGVHYAKEWAHKLLRFYIQGNAFVSRS